MAKTFHSGIIPGAEAKKLYSYPTLSSSSDTFLRGSGTWADADNITVGTAKQAVKLQTPVNLEGFEFDGTQSIGRYARCSTKADVAIKHVDDMPGFTATAGSWLCVFFGNANTAESPTLQIGTGEPLPMGESKADGFYPLTGDDSFRLVRGAYFVIRAATQDAWVIVAGPPGFYPTATSAANGFMSKTDKAAHDTMVSALTNQCTTTIDASGCMVVKLFGSNTPFIKIDKAGEW